MSTPHNIAMAKQWREEADKLETSVERFEAGEIKLIHNGVDVSAEHIAQLRRAQVSLRDGASILDGSADAGK